MKPNIFNYAKSELTNDAIICWMLDWTNSEHEIYKNLSQDMIRLFTKNKDLDVEYVNIKKQYKNIDVLVEVNDSEVIVIEDKVKTSSHSNQLERYKDTIDKEEDDINKWDWETWEGYYNHLQLKDDIKDGYWHYVSNPKGGFLAFIWNCEDYNYVKDNKKVKYYIYPQIESNSGNSNGEKTKISFKVECKDTAYRKELRENIYERLEKLLKEYVSTDDLKRTKLKDGLHMTLIEINNINTRTELEEIIKFSTKCLEEIKCQLTEGEVYTNV